MACVNQPWLDWQLSSCVSTNEFIISKYQSRYHFDLWDRKDTTYEWIKEPNSAGANAFLYFEFSVWCRLITVTRKASSGSYHLTAASRHPSRSLTSSSLIVLLITVLVQQKKLKHVTNCSCTNKKKLKGAWNLSYPLIIPIWVITRCVELILPISRIWSVGKRRAITIITAWKQ